VGTLLVAVAAFVAMEPVTALTHRLVMHGAGHRLHRSHHRRVPPGGSPRRFEANDAFPVVFAAVVGAALAVGFNVDGAGWLVPAGLGVTAYGVAYALVHDVYIHRRLPVPRGTSVAVLDRLAAAHRVHHRTDGAPYGMLVPLLPRRRAGGGATPHASGSRPSHVPTDA